MTNPASGEQGTPQITPGSAPAQGQGTPTPAATPGATGTPPADDKGHKTVPITAMHEERDKRQAAEAKGQELTTEIENLKAMLGQYQQPQDPYQQYQQPYPQQQPYQQPYQQPGQYQQPAGMNPAYNHAPQPIKEQIDALWQEDIRKGFQAEMQAMMQYRDWVDSKIDSEFEASRGRHAADFNQYEGKIRTYMRSLPADAKSQPNIVEAAYLMVKGQNADALLKQKEDQFKQLNGQAGAGLTGTFGTPGQPAGSPTLSQEEMQAAAAMKLSPEDYLKYRG